MFYVTGDTHGGADMAKIYDLQGKLTSADHLIILGDFGFIWSRYGDDEEERALNWFYAMPWTTLFIDGNHENHRRLNALAVSEWHGGKVHVINKKVIHLMRGQYYTIEGVRFFAFGGAESTDKLYRTVNVSWWKEELPSDTDYAEADKNLATHHYETDYVLTHDIGFHYATRLSPQHALFNRQTIYLDDLDKNLTFKHWYCGHHHQDIDLDDKHTCLYNTVRRL